jgi:hypothetical protein
MKEVLERVSLQLPRRCLFVLISDFFVSQEEIDATLGFLHYRGHDAVVLQVLDPDEREFPFESNILFKGLEDDRQLLTEPHRLRERYLAVLEGALGHLKKSCEGFGFDYQLITGPEKISEALAKLLAQRARRRKAASRKG